MIGRLFWLLTMACVAIAAHLVTVLYAPGFSFERSVARAGSGHTTNSFFILKPELQGALVLSASEQDIVGLCLVDLSKGNIVFSATVPAGLWTLAVYAESGQQVYGINDLEAGALHFSVELAKAKSVIQQLTKKPDAEDATAIDSVGWHAEVNGKNAVAVLWVPVPDAARRGTVEAQVMGTSCAVK